MPANTPQFQPAARSSQSLLTLIVWMLSPCQSVTAVMKRQFATTSNAGELVL